MTWKGVILEESLKDKSLLDFVKIVKTDVENLEEENRVMTFHKVELEDGKEKQFLEKAKKVIKPAFYMHICKDGIMHVVFEGKVFKFTKDSAELTKAREYGKSIGILEVQMPFEKLVKAPWS